MEIHPTAVVHPKAELADDVVIGPYCIVGEHVTIGRGTTLVSHVSVDGWTEIGERCHVYPFASIGGPPQHLHYKGEPTKVIIGNDNILREYVTVNRATVQGGGVTRLGHHNFLMAYVHVAHDCHLGDHLIMANCANLAGHITIGDYAIIGGLTGIHQFVRVGAYAMVGGCCGLTQDVAPFTRAAGGYRARMYGINYIGLKRQGFTNEQLAVLKRAYDLLFRSGHRLAEAVKLVRKEFASHKHIMEMADFVNSTRRGLCASVGRDEETDE